MNTQVEQEPVIEENGVQKILQEAVKGVTAKISEMDKAIQENEAEHARLVELRKNLGYQATNHLQEAILSLEGEFSTMPKTIRPMKKSEKTTTEGKKTKRTPRDGSTRQLILEYLGQIGQATTGEIRSFLEDQGKNTNPGVELSRMVKDQVIQHAERGRYIKVN